MRCGEEGFRACACFSCVKQEYNILTGSIYPFAVLSTQLYSPRCAVSYQSPDEHDQLFDRFLTFQCRDCNSTVGFRSRRRTFSERYLLPLFLLRPVRCGECFRRDYRLIFTPVHDRLSETSKAVQSVKPPTAPTRNVA
jgi:hypothetical protein